MKTWLDACTSVYFFLEDCLLLTHFCLNGNMLTAWKWCSLSCPKVLLAVCPSLALFQVGLIDSGKSSVFSCFWPDPIAKEMSFLQILLVALPSTTKTGCFVSNWGSCLATGSLALLWKHGLLQVAATEVNEAADVLGSVQSCSSTLCQTYSCGQHAENNVILPGWCTASNTAVYKWACILLGRSLTRRNGRNVLFTTVVTVPFLVLTVGGENKLVMFSSMPRSLPPLTIVSRT